MPVPTRTPRPTSGDQLTSDEVAAIQGSTPVLTQTNLVVSQDLLTSNNGSLMSPVATVAGMNAIGSSDGWHYWCTATQTLYEYVVAGSGYGSPDNTYVLATVTGGNTRWVGRAGQYIYDYKSRDSAIVAGLLRIYADITAAKAATSVDGLICYVKSLNNFYRGLAAGSAYTANDKAVLTTGDAGNTRWIGVGPLYVAAGNLPNVIVAAATGNLPTNAVNGAFVTNYGQGQANTLSIPAALVGESFVFTVETAGAGAVNLDPQNADIITLNGTALSAGVAAGCATPAVGDTISFWCLRDGFWIANSSRGTWA
jgi:hypothetical protein